MSRTSTRTRGLAAATAALFAATLPAPLCAQNILSTGKKITLPPLGTPQNVGSLPMNMVLSPDGRYAVATDMGFRQALSVVDTLTGAVVSQTPFVPDPNTPGQNAADPKKINLYYGLVFAPKANPDGSYTLYASQGSKASIGVYTLSGGTLTASGTIALRPGDFPAGLALDGRGYLYVAVNEYYGGPDATAPLTTPGQLAVYNTNVSPAVEAGRVTVGNPALLNNFPLSVAALADGSKVYVSTQRDGAVYVFNATNPAAPTASGVLPTGAHPDALLLNKAQTKLYVANAHSDTISILNTADNSLASTVLLQPAGARGLAGVTPTGLALSPDEKTLYATLGDMNAVAVVDAAAGTLQGYIPAGWYPTAVVASPLKKQILIADAKGTVPRNPNPGQKVYDLPGGKSTDNAGRYYDLNIIEGQVQTIPVPNSVQLAADTQQVLSNNRLGEIGSAPPVFGQIGLKSGGITHVIYIIKENRTYDQVLGDLPAGNGDPSLAIFGKAVTPNLHTLASRFVLLDNFYDCSEASGDGWPWSTQSMANEYVIKNLPYNYSGRGRNYDFEGQNNGYLVGGFPAKDPDGKPLSALPQFANGAPALPDVSEAPAHHIWDLAENAGLSLRNYGFFLSTGVSLGGVSLLPDNYPAAAGLREAGHYEGGALNAKANGISDYDFRKFDTDYPDSDAPALYGNKGWKTVSYGKYAMPSRFAEWDREFEQMVKNDPTGGTVPNFMMVRFMNDHTAGVAKGVASPQAHVADNDYSVGQMVQAISKYPDIWKHTAIFVIEDDSQDGPDHVDCHRSTCYVLSPYVRQNSVDHTFYNTDSVLRTMELLLGLPPMSQYDAVATPILDFDAAPSNAAVYTATLPDPGIITDVPTAFKPGTPLAHLAKLTQTMDLVHPDSAPAGLLNEVIWKSVRGFSSKMPAPRHGLEVTKAAPGKRPVKADADGDGE